MAKVKKKMVLIIEDNEIIGAADLSLPAGTGASLDISPIEGQELYDLEIPAEILKLHPAAFERALSEAFRVPGAVTKHVPAIHNRSKS